MRFFAVLNRQGGSLRTTDLDAFTTSVRDTLQTAGHSLEIELVSGDDLIAALDRAASSDADVVLAGGGDGTISAAAGRLMGTPKALAVLPAGTMNLFARGLGIPLTLDEAVAAFAGGEIRQVDIATANGRPFVHQFSIGMHARLVKLRSKMEFASRLGKIRASIRAAWLAVMNPPAIRVRIDVGNTEIEARATALGVTNNVFGEGHLPYADRPDGGVLGIYFTVARQRGELLRLLWNIARGKWRDNEQVEVHEAKRVTLTVQSRRKRLAAVLDGELVTLEKETDIRIHPGQLRVLVPSAKAPAKAA
jgi:diacylglycerol kinase family enzyme